jgi:SAM-dependent methyltransferase
MSFSCPHTGTKCDQLGSIHPQFAALPESSSYFVSNDGVIYSAKAQSVDYGPDYFLTEYEEQYGKSYLDDESNLRRMAVQRLNWLTQVIDRQGTEVDWGLDGPDLLEIGSAAGFFLDEATAQGWNACGLEISPYASTFAINRGHSVLTASFLDAPENAFSEISERAPAWKEMSLVDAGATASSTGRPVPPGRSGLSARFDCVVAFYTIEHFPDQREGFQRMADLLRPGGFLLLALPSYNGPVFRCSPRQWIETHPLDHFADYCPASLRNTMDHYELDLLESRPASYHQKRTCGFKRLWPRSIYRNWARRNSFGDTMEVVARKRILK